MTNWANDAIFYHIYPLGLCGAPPTNDLQAEDNFRLNQLNDWIGHLSNLGINALYLGPVFESSSHGYDTIDYYRVDRRLGNNETLAALTRTLHENGIRVILDGVFNHVGRDFWAFRDLQANMNHSAYRDWFSGINFERRSPYGDPFSYDGWNGHHNLVKLNLHHPDLRKHLFDAVGSWINQFNIDGLRLDAADVIDFDFLSDLAGFCRSLRSDFWLTGEVIHGDYRKWANPKTLDSTTNYECYKGLFSSLNDQNYFEIAYALNRQFGEHGIYRGLPLYTFADNHDVTRVASALKNPQHLYPLYTLLFTMPGVPSIYYGSEWGIPGIKEAHDDRSLRPMLERTNLEQNAPIPGLFQAIKQFIRIHHETPALRQGDYRPLHVSHEQLAFSRSFHGETVVVAINAASQPIDLSLKLASQQDGKTFIDLLEPHQPFTSHNGCLKIDSLPPYHAHILAMR